MSSTQTHEPDPHRPPESVTHQAPEIRIPDIDRDPLVEFVGEIGSLLLGDKTTLGQLADALRRAVNVVFEERESANSLGVVEVADPVNHPPHYAAHPSGVECIQVTEHFDFCLGNAIKYIWRAGRKGDALEDLKKARWYLDREITRREAMKDA